MSNVQVSPRNGATEVSRRAGDGEIISNQIHVDSSDTHANYWSEWATNRERWNAVETRRDVFKSRFFLAVKVIGTISAVGIFIMWLANLLSAIH
jgi:hypothetical protein